MLETRNASVPLLAAIERLPSLGESLREVGLAVAAIVTQADLWQRRVCRPQFPYRGAPAYQPAGPVTK